MNLVAADVRRLILFSGKKSEPPDIGCYSSRVLRAKEVLVSAAFPATVVAWLICQTS